MRTGVMADRLNSYHGRAVPGVEIARITDGRDCTVENSRRSAAGGYPCFCTISSMKFSISGLSGEAASEAESDIIMQSTAEASRL